jgi:hypothetical protein
MGELLYLYAITDASALPALTRANLRAIEGGDVRTIVEGELLGVTSHVPDTSYEETPLNERLQDLDWLAPRAAVHQDVNAKLLDLAPSVVPLAFGAIYRGPEGVRALLRSRAADLLDRLRSVEGRAEWIISVEREATDLPPGESLRVLDGEIAAAAPGRAFLLGKRRDEVVREERRARDAAVAEETQGFIEDIVERIYREPLIDDPTATAVARFSVLVPRVREIGLGDAVRRLHATDVARGYRVRLSGPWPAYRFGGLPSERVGSA